MRRAKRLLVGILARTDEAMDVVLYRPFAVRAFVWLPRWWLSDLAKLSVWLDDQWHTGWWEAAGVVPGGPCEACRRRASIHLYGGPTAEGELAGDYLDNRVIALCGWCQLPVRPFADEGDVRAALEEAAARSVSWRWR